MLDILIKDSSVIDGTGRPPMKADVGIAAGRVAVIAQAVEQDAARIIQARGLHLAPGFIDPHTHSDLTLLANPKAESAVRQGVTTQVIGNCGDSPAPLAGASLEEARASAANIGVTVEWRSMVDYRKHLEQSGIAVNVVLLAGHNTVRGAVMGYGDAQPTPPQQFVMEQVVEEMMGQGVRGVSTGLAYPPGIYCHTDEVIGLAKAVGRYRGIYASHIRNEGAGVLDAIDEALEIGIRAEIPVQCSHIKISGADNWGLIDQLLEALNSEKARDARLGCDQYPYTAGHTWLAGILPHWAQAGGSKAIARRLRERDVRDRLAREWGENQGGARDWSGILVTDCAARPEVVGKNIAEIAADDGKAPLEAAFDLIVVSESQVACVFFSQDEEIMKTLMREPFVAIGSDSSARAPYGALGKSSTHPRAYGTFARVLGKYVREERVITLEEAVRKMTSMTAERFGLTDRGVIRKGARADLVLFDAQSVNDRATYVDPHQYAEGIPYVFVNGQVVIDQGQHTGALPGRVL